MPKSRKRKKTKKKVANNFAQRNRNKVLEQNRTKRLQENLNQMQLPKTPKIKRNALKHKVSELLVEYGEDLLDECYEREDYHKAMMMLILCWNTGIVADTKEEIDKALDSMLEKMHVSSEKAFFVSMVEKKKRFYGEYNYIIMNYDIDFSDEDNPYISVVSFDKNNPIM